MKANVWRRHGIGLSVKMLSAVSVSALAIASPAYAQESDEQAEAEEARESSRADIIVTAQFREQRLQDTPIAITAISGEDIENKGLNSIADIAATAPNVTITQSSSAYGGAAIYIRGIGQYDSNFALEPGVGVYIDDVYHGTQVGSLFDLLDLERVEILRGPQGTLAGKNSIGGSVKLFSRKPKGTNDGYLQATYGSYDRIEVRGAFDLGLSDNLFARISGFSKRRDGHVKLLDFACDQPGQILPTDTFPTQVTGSDCQTGTLGGIKSWGVRGALRFLPTDTVEINIAGSIIRDDSEAAGVEQAGTADTRFIPTRDYINYSTYVSENGWIIKPVATSAIETISGSFDWDISDNLHLTTITAYENLKSQWSIDGDGGPLGTAQTFNSSPYHQFTQEVRLGGEIGEGVAEWTIGGFYFRSKGNVAARVYSFPALNFIQDDPVTSTSKSVFAHVVIHPTEDFGIIGGIRYTDDKKDYTFSRLDPDTGLPAAIVGSLDGVTETYAGDSIDYRFGLNYRFSDAFMAYANFSTGYKGGGINPRPFIPSQVVPFASERVNAYEFGVKSDLADGLVRLNAAIFLSKYKDIILIDANGFPGAPGDPGYFFLSAAPFNAGDADIKGFEVEANVEPTKGLTISGSLSYLDFEYTRLDSNASDSGITTAFVPPFTPKWKWSTRIAYEIPLSNGATLTPQVYIDHTDSVFTDPVNAATNFLASRTIANANITFNSASDDWSAVVGVTNIGNKKYFSNAFDITTVNGNNTKVVARPREFFVTLRRNF